MVGPDTRVHDPLALAEIELYGELVIAASASDGRLAQDQIDAILGVARGAGSGGGRDAGEKAANPGDVSLNNA